MIRNNSINPFSLARRIDRPLILDGAMGSMLQKKGLKSQGSMWMSKANLEDPEQVIQIHKEYILAGADIITTNTFRTNPEAVSKFNKRINNNKLVKIAVELAMQATKGLPVFIAGSNAPAEDCYQRKRDLALTRLEANHHKHIDLLIDSGCHFVLNETQSHFDEIKIISKYCFKNSIPYILSLFVDESLNLLSGESSKTAIEFIRGYNPLAIGINCVKPKTFMRLFEKNKLDFNWGVYLNAGKGSFADEIITTGISPEEYTNLFKKVLLKSPSFVGGCCGTTPNHIKSLKRLIDGKSRN
ncbi:MAG: homocysteine S-methyltransferase family protein [Ignavibacteriaceae bacterium]